MRPHLAMAIVGIACWDAWRLLAGRIEDGAAGVLIAALIAALGWRMWRADPAARIAPRLPTAMLALYTLACITGPALVQIGVAALAVGLIAWKSGRDGVPPWPAAGLLVLALPILPTLDFLLAYPLRRLSAMLTVAILRLNGVDVGLKGIALDWHGQLLLFDGPCSGVRMLWAALMLASLIGLVRGFGLRLYLRKLTLAVTLAIGGNALRVASLFYVENGFIPQLQGPVMHEAVGLVAFLLLALVAVGVIGSTDTAPRKAG